METTDFIIRSVRTEKQLRFFDADGYSFWVELRGASIHGAREVHCPLGPTELIQFFSRLGALVRPWSGTERYTSVEGDFSLAAACSSLGQVTLTIVIHGAFGAPEEWQVRSGLELELGNCEESQRRRIVSFVPWQTLEVRRPPQ